MQDFARVREKYPKAYLNSMVTIMNLILSLLAKCQVLSISTLSGINVSGDGEFGHVASLN